MTNKVEKKFLIQYRENDELAYKELLYIVLDSASSEDFGIDFIYNELVKEHGEINVKITELDVSELDNEVIQELSKQSV